MSTLNIFLDIEALLDTRYGRLLEIDPKLELEILFKYSEYYNRDHDNFWLIFPEIDKETYLNKTVTKETLKKSRRTNILHAIDDAIRGMDRVNTEDTDIKLILNVQDYEINEEEELAFKVLLSERFNHRFKIEVTRLTLEEITPKWLKKNAKLTILYDFNDWCSIHANSIGKDKISETVFYAPALFMDKQDADRNFHQLIVKSGIEGNPLEIISDYLWDNYQMNIHFIANKYFSPLTLA